MGEPFDLEAARTGHGRYANAAGFVQLVQENPGFWTFDYALKYLKISLDTREGAHFVLRDRDDNLIDPERVLRAIDRYGAFLRGEPALLESPPQ